MHLWMLYVRIRNNMRHPRSQERNGPASSILAPSGLSVAPTLLSGEQNRSSIFRRPRRKEWRVTHGPSCYRLKGGRWHAEQGNSGAGGSGAQDVGSVPGVPRSGRVIGDV